MRSRARFYNPDTGRFISSDPDPGDIRVPISINNQYVYTGNNPINYVDPSGGAGTIMSGVQIYLEYLGNLP